MRWRFVIWVCAAFVAGAFTGWGAHGCAERAPVTGVADVARPSAARVVNVRAPTRSCETAVAECEHARDFYRAQLAVYEGVPQPWSTDVPSAFTEAPLRETLTQSLAGIATLNELACDEYPCIALVALTSDDPSCCEQVSERLPEPVRQKIGGAYMYQTEDGRMAAALAFGAPDRWNADIGTRATWRMEQMVEESQDP